MLTVCCFTSQMTTFSRMEDSDSETCRNIRAGGLSDDESAEWEEALKAIYYSDEDVLLTPPVFVMMSSMYVPICNRFHVIRANNGKMTSF